MITIFEIKRACPVFFSKENVSFFNSRIAGNGRVFEGPGGIYFITSEQFVPTHGQAYPRRYSVRLFNPDGGHVKIETAGKFNEIETYIEAERQAESYAKGEKP